jgi:LPXTG-motif cell wall-anchored protein
MPWLAILAAGLLLAASGAVGLRRSRRTVAAVRD